MSGDLSAQGSNPPAKPSQAVRTRLVSVCGAEIERLEDAGDLLMRLGHPFSAVEVWALALRFRRETRWPSRNALVRIGGDS